MYQGTAGSFNRVAKLAYNSTTWTTVGSGTGGGFISGYVNSLAVDSNNNLYAGGNFTTTASATSVKRVARSVGGTGNWTAIGAGAGGGFSSGDVYSQAVDSNNNLYAGGNFTATTSGTAVINIAKYG